ETPSPVIAALFKSLPATVCPQVVVAPDVNLVTKAYVPTPPFPAGILAPGTVPELSLPASIFAIFTLFTAPLAILALVTALLFIPLVCTLGAPAAPSAIAIGLSRKAKPSIARIGLPGSILSVGILVHCAIFHLTKSTGNHRRSRRHRVYVRQHLPTKHPLGARILWRPRSLAR